MDPVALITGASSGVGAVTAERFAADGYAVTLIARGEDGLREVASRIEADGGRALVVPTDVTDEDAVQTAVDRTLEEFGRLDVLVLNAAVTIFGSFSEVEPEDFRRVVDVTFMGGVNVTRAAMPALTDAEGVIVSVGSLNSRVPLPSWSSYCAAKHAQRGWLNTLAVELQAERSPVRIAQVHPGALDTPVWDETPTAVGYAPNRPPASVSPEDVAEAVLELAHDPVPERYLGSEAVLLDHLWRHVRPVGDTVLGLAHHYFNRSWRRLLPF